MNRLVILTSLLLLPLCLSAGILNDADPALSGEDSLCLTLLSLDSVGNPTLADSLFFVVTDPSGKESYRDSLTTTDSRLSTISLGGVTAYRFADAAANLVGGSSAGRYAICALMKRSDGLVTAQTTWFQLVGYSLSQRLGRIDADISGLSSGSGAYSVLLAAVDTTAGLPIPYVGIAVRSLDQSVLLASGRTDSDGRAHFNLDSGSYLVTATASGYLFTAPDTIVVDGAAADTIVAARFDPGIPASPALCRVYGWVYAIDGAPSPGATVSLRLAGSEIRSNGLIISPFAVSSTTDSAGYFAIDVYPSTELEPSETPYEVSINRPGGGIVRRRVVIPSLASWQLTW